MKVKDLGEHGLLERLQPFCLSSAIGDDGAVLVTDPAKSLVVSTDVLVDQVHFSDRTTTAFDVGWRGAAANLSDLAAMGATPLGITVGLSLPGEVAVSWVEELYRGMQACLSQYDTSIVGGDICRSQVITIGITALGEVSPHRIIRRSNARPGDQIVVTGNHGLSKAGLELLLDPALGSNLNSAERDSLIAAHQRPLPRLDVVEVLERLAPDTAMAGMDSSDGLADAIAQICRYSGVGAEIDLSEIEIFPAIEKLAGAETALNWVLYGGEDFELVLCLPKAISVEVVEHLGAKAAIIGKITSGSAIDIFNYDHMASSQILNLTKGFQHF
ncbi:MAG: thiamine-phosphate kinase [Pleurocapsa sp.]